MDIRHYLDELEIDEPIGFEDLELSIKRDAKFHGMQFEASTSTLEFYGEGAAYLQGKKALQGLSANVIYRATIACEGDADAAEAVRGRLNFGKYRESCGTTCRVSMPVEEDSCQVIFKSRFDQKVDLDNPVAFDKITGLPPYTGLGITMEIPAKALEVGGAGRVADGSNAINDNITSWIGTDLWIARPTYEVSLDESLKTTQLIPTGDHEWQDDEFSIPITPQLLFEDTITCFPDQVDYEFEYTGSFLIENSLGFELIHAKLKVVTWDGNGNIFTNGTLIEEILLPDTYTGTSYFGTFFDQVLSGSIVLTDGIGVYSYLELNIDNSTPFGDFDINVTFAPQTTMSITAVKLCPASDAQVYLIHETLSRITEAITNRCIRVRSDYYGRIDSEPFAADADGCGGLRLLTSGLKLRQAPEDQDKFFLSAKDALEGLWAIDNIGFGIEDDTTLPGFFVLRVEPVEYFYQDTEILALPYIPDADSDVQESGHYSRVLMGYKRWEVEEVNGLGEPNSNREYRTSLDTISNTLDATSVLVAGSYPIEITRQQSFAASGAADTSYDNETFIICVERDPYGFSVEQGNISSPANIFDPATILNYRLTPARNMMRWAKSVLNSYANISSSSDRIFFNAGTGNITAEGQLSDTECRLEAGVLAENQDISISTFANQADALPLFRPEYITFEYPLSVAQYQELKANPYGKIAYGCGSAEYLYGFIKEIKFKVAKGKATFTLIKKW